MTSQETSESFKDLNINEEEKQRKYYFDYSSPQKTTQNINYINSKQEKKEINLRNLNDVSEKLNFEE